MAAEKSENAVHVFIVGGVPMEGTEIIDRVIEIIKASLELSGFVFPEVEKALDLLIAFGKLVLALSGETPEDPVIKKLDELEHKIDMLAKKMDAKFAVLKAFMIEIKFDELVIQPTTILMQYMSDSFHHPSKKGTANFLEAYKSHKPLNLAYTVMSQMKQDTTNPLKMAMAADILKTSTTFNTWESIISGVLGQFLFLEAYANGLQEDKDPYDRERMKENSTKLLGDIGKWRAEYTERSEYWLGLKTFIEQFQDDNINMKVREKAEKLKGVLDKVMTNDALYIIMYNTTSENHWFDSDVYVHLKDQYIESPNRAHCSVIVYRSKQANSVDIAKLDEMKKQVDECSNVHLRYFFNITGDAEQFYENPIYNAGFIFLLMVSEDVELHLLPVNYSRRELGPGWSTTIRIGQYSIWGSWYFNYRLVAGYV